MMLRGFTVVNYQPVDFTLADCPVVLNEETLALGAINKSNLLDLSMIIRGDEETGAFEGDLVVKDNEVIGRIVYSKGFYVHDFSGNLKKIEELGHIEMKQGSIKDIKLSCSYAERTEVLFGYKGKQLRLNSFLTKQGNYLIIQRSYKSVDPRDVSAYTGCNNPEDDSPLYFGDIYKGGVITSKKGIPMVKFDNNCFEQI